MGEITDGLNGGGGGGGSEGITSGTSLGGSLRERPLDEGSAVIAGPMNSGSGGGRLPALEESLSDKLLCVLLLLLLLRLRLLMLLVLVSRLLSTV